MKESVHVSKTAILAGLIFTLILTATPAMAGITYTLTDLTDTEDNMYQITYAVNGFDSTTYAGLDIYFDYATYSDVTLVADDASGDWDETYIYPSNIGLALDSMLDALAVTQSSNLSGSFTVTFYYTGENLPGAQYVEYYDASYNVAATGQTSAVPVPNTALLLFAGIAGILAFNRKARLL